MDGGSEGIKIIGSSVTSDWEPNTNTRSYHVISQDRFDRCQCQYQGRIEPQEIEEQVSGT